MRYVRDPALVAFTFILCCAASITAHGTYVFYSFILDGWLPYFATAVLTLGIPLLELAAVLDKENRARYVAGMVWLLAMEGIAQYWQGQAFFTTRVLAHFQDASGVDLVTFARHPAGRLLPIIYLAALSAVVVYFGYAASARYRALRGAVKQKGHSLSSQPRQRLTRRQPRRLHCLASCSGRALTACHLRRLVSGWASAAKPRSNGT